MVFYCIPLVCTTFAFGLGKVALGNKKKWFSFVFRSFCTTFAFGLGKAALGNKKKWFSFVIPLVLHYLCLRLR